MFSESILWEQHCRNTEICFEINKICWVSSKISVSLPGSNCKYKGFWFEARVCKSRWIKGNGSCFILFIKGDLPVFNCYFIVNPARGSKHSNLHPKAFYNSTLYNSTEHEIYYEWGTKPAYNSAGFGDQVSVPVPIQWGDILAENQRDQLTETTQTTTKK